MITMRVRSAAGLVVLSLLASATACAPKKVDLPDPTVAAKFPDFVFPVVPEGLGTPPVLERHNAGWLWLQAGDLRAAERSFDATLQLMPQFYPAEAGLGWVGLARKNSDGAVTHFDRAVVANPRYVPALVGRGEALLALGDRSMALKSFEAAVAADANLTQLRSRIELLRFRGLQDDVAEARKAAEVGRLQEAQTAYQRAIASSPQSPFLFRELAIVERRAGNLAAVLSGTRRKPSISSQPSRAISWRSATSTKRRASSRRPSKPSMRRTPWSRTPESNGGSMTCAKNYSSRPCRRSSRKSKPRPPCRALQLAALLGVRLDDLLKRAPRRTSAVITDTRGSWASPWILLVARSGRDGDLSKPHVSAGQRGPARRSRAGHQPCPVADSGRESAPR